MKLLLNFFLNLAVVIIADLMMIAAYHWNILEHMFAIFK
jgi:hypothetical protein